MLQRKNIATDNLHKISYKNSINENSKDLHPRNHTEKEERVRENQWLTIWSKNNSKRKFWIEKNFFVKTKASVYRINSQPEIQNSHSIFHS